MNRPLHSSSLQQQQGPQPQENDIRERVTTPTTMPTTVRPTLNQGLGEDSSHHERAMSVLSALGFSSSWDVNHVDTEHETEITFAQSSRESRAERDFGTFDVENPPPSSLLSNNSQKPSGNRRVSFSDEATTVMANTMSTDSSSGREPDFIMNQRENFIGEFSDPRASIRGRTTASGKTKKRPALERRQSSAEAMGQMHRRRHNMLRVFRRRRRQNAWEPSLSSADSEQQLRQQEGQHRVKVSVRNDVEPMDDNDDNNSKSLRKESYASAPTKFGWSKLFGRNSKNSSPLGGTGPLNSRQYNLTTDHGQGSAVRQFLKAYLGIAFEYDDANGTRQITCYGMSLDLLVIEYLHWCFRSSFAAVFLSLWFAFLSWSFLFAVVLWFLGRQEPTCIGGVDYESDYFVDAWALSWTTFSTVGYGLIYSGISADEPDIHKCTAITIVVALESFVGVLFASFLGAIIFAKVARTQSYAQIMFSDPVLIRFGDGVLGDHVEANSSNEATPTATPQAASNEAVGQQNNTDGNNNSPTFDRRALQDQQHRQRSMTQQKQQDSIAELAEHGLVPPPVLEFQLVNRLNGVRSGEIMDASINIVAAINADQACHTIKNATKRRRKKKSKKRATPRPGESESEHNDVLISMEDEESEGGTEHHSEHHWKIHDVAKFSTILKSFESDHEPLHVSFEEDPTGHLVPHQIFSRLEVETQDHPFFRRIWTVRHVLDANSPLLTTAARDLVNSCGGLWPKDVTTAKYVRHAVNFDQLLVSFSGTSNADANTVYAQKVYDYDALNIGFRFVNMLYRDRMSGRVQVDLSLINDVRTQDGGGAENLYNPLGDTDSVERKLNHLAHSGSIRDMIS
eukprot:CAMPEP_0168725594 /NCGR_PEP_ID=MMETSP0724-20121128/4235_1 /TAXON_ID=265536 /ORGANISM="Amphiprora sp., Strain CCMP467" /LENGTH=851 /DNA_ID=CAMNT_0008772385 /DNA_START=178 /DNA_END=2730 /DNA_ORIENTATION=-